MKDDFETMSDPAKAIGPASDYFEELTGVKVPTLFGFGVAAAAQAMKDANQPGLSGRQRVARAIATGIEDVVVGVIAKAAGVEYALSATGVSLVAAPEASLYFGTASYYTGYTIGYVLTTITYSYFTDMVNTSVVFPVIQGVVR